jgi:hypothetical protein
MATAHVQPIAGVSTGGETEIMSVFPSIAATGIGRGLGRLFNAIPMGSGPVRLSHLLFTLPFAPVAVLLYFVQKISGQRFMLTNRALVVKSALGRREAARVDLPAIAGVRVVQQPGQEFYRCADVQLLDAAGKAILRLPAIPQAAIFRASILKARDAVLMVKSSLDVINARHPA